MVGVLILTHPDIGYFNESQLSLVETIAAQLTTAISNAYLFNAVSEQQRKLQAIYSQSNDAIISTDEELSITLFNESARKPVPLASELVAGAAGRDSAAGHAVAELFHRRRSEAISQEVTLTGRTRFSPPSRPFPGSAYIAVMRTLPSSKRLKRCAWTRNGAPRNRSEGHLCRYMGPRLVDHVLSEEPGLLARRGTAPRGGTLCRSARLHAHGDQARGRYRHPAAQRVLLRPDRDSSTNLTAPSSIWQATS